MWAGSASAETLRILTWEGYADADYIKEFEAETGATVQATFVGDDAEIWAKVRGSNGEDADIITTNVGQLQRYVDSGLLAPIDMDKLPNQAQALERFRDLSKIPGVVHDNKPYMIPFYYGAYLLAYNPDMVDEAPTSWNVLWDPKYKGMVLTHDSYEYNFTIAAIMDGVKDPYHLSEEQLQKYKEKEIELKRQLLAYYSFSDEAVQMYKNNDIAVMVAGYGKQMVKAIRDSGAKVEAVFPKEGAPVWLDAMAITKGATPERAELAHKWINFILSKKIAQAMVDRNNQGSTIIDTDVLSANDKVFWVKSVEDPTRRSDLWNEIKATP
jgi:putative spermidine/putrescine transport system substrate-binding protein